MLAEGAVADWSAVYLARSAGAGAGLAALGYSAFALAMTISRLTGDRLSERLAPSALVGGGGALAAAGLGGALAIGSAAAGLVGFVAMGAGLGVVIPVLFRAAGTAPGATAGVGVATVSTIGWLGFLAGPAAIGFAAGLVGLRSALTIVVGTSIVLAALGRLIRSSPPVAFEPRAVLSDLDGVLVDSTGSTTRAWRSFAERNGLDPEVILAEMHGRRSEDLVRLVAPGLDAPREAADVERRQTDDSDDVRALPGARELIAAIPPDRFAIVTSCPEPLARARLRAAGLPVPAVLITSERVGAGKPDPEGYVNAARTLGVDPAHCLVLEDAPVGVAAGLAAGMTVFAVVTTHAEADLHAAHRRVADLCVLLPFSVRSTAEDGAPLLN
jgi:sugar-phosphatase